MKVLSTALLFASLVHAVERGEEIKHWPNGAPGSEGITAAEVSKPSANPKYKGWPGGYSLSQYDGPASDSFQG